MAFKGCKYQAFGDSITEQVKKQVNKTGRRLLLKKISTSVHSLGRDA